MADITNNSGTYQNQDIGKKDAIVRNLASINLTLSQKNPIAGNFLMTNTASKTVTASVLPGSTIVLTPVNANAGLLQGSAKCLYIVSNTGFFTVYTSNTAIADGTESFNFLIQP
jgi:hypothetical protein